MEITKVKDDGTTMLVKWKTERGEDMVSHELSSLDRPHADFHQAMKSLVPEVLRLLELPEMYGEEFRVQSLSISLQEDNWGVVITSLKKLKGAHAPLVLNTPHLTDEPTSEGGLCLPGNLARRIEDVLDEARMFVKGKREQGDLFVEAA